MEDTAKMAVTQYIFTDSSASGEDGRTCRRAGHLCVRSYAPPRGKRWSQIFQGERMTAALLDRLTHHCHIFEMNGESYRFRESVKKSKSGWEQGP
jgi:IstB-like ATP binding protein